MNPLRVQDADNQKINILIMEIIAKSGVQL